LSNATCVTRASASSASGRASTTPRRPSAPAAAASAAGVASESAQGHETTSSAKLTGPGGRNGRGESEQPRDEDRRRAIGEPRDARAGGGREVDHPHHGRELGRLAGRGHADHEGAVARDRAREHAVARAPRVRPALAGQHRLLDERRAVGDDAVGRHRQRRGVDGRGARAGPGLVTLGGRRQRARGALDRLARALARGELDQPRGEQEGDEHRDRVVVDRAAGPERRPRARAERRREPERDRDVHAEPPPREVAPGAREERPRGPRDDRDRHHEARPVEQPLVLGGDAFVGQVARHREHHHLHHREQRDAGADDERAPLGARERLPAGGIVGVRAVADRGDRGDHAVERRLAVAPDDPRAPRREVDARLDDPRLAREPRFDEPHARAAGEPVEQQRDLAQPPRQRADEPGGGGRGVPRDRALAFAGRGGVRSGARQVVAIEAGPRDRRRDREAARAAERALLARDRRAPARPGRHRRAAMPARGAPRRARRDPGARGGARGSGRLRRHPSIFLPARGERQG